MGLIAVFLKSLRFKPPSGTATVIDRLVAYHFTIKHKMFKRSRVAYILANFIKPNYIPCHSKMTFVTHNLRFIFFYIDDIIKIIL